MERPRSAVYLHFQRQRKACPETDILFHLATCLPILYLFHMLLYVFHTSFSKTILHTLVYARHVHELQTANPWAGWGRGGRNNEGGITTREYGIYELELYRVSSQKYTITSKCGLWPCLLLSARSVTEC